MYLLAINTEDAKNFVFVHQLLLLFLYGLLWHNITQFRNSEISIQLMHLAVQAMPHIDFSTLHSLKKKPSTNSRLCVIRVTRYSISVYSIRIPYSVLKHVKWIMFIQLYKCCFNVWSFSSLVLVFTWLGISLPTDYPLQFHFRKERNLRLFTSSWKHNVSQVTTVVTLIFSW
jgi:hypothetical protein